MKIDSIIVGQGLAGTLTAWGLIKRKKSVLVIDNRHFESASKIAAGLINPVSGQRFVLTPGFETFFPAAQNTYQELGTLLSEKFYFSKDVVRVFKDSKEFTSWNERKDKSKSSRYIKSYNPPHLHSQKRPQTSHLR